MFTTIRSLGWLRLPLVCFALLFGSTVLAAQQSRLERKPKLIEVPASVEVTALTVSDLAQAKRAFIGTVLSISPTTLSGRPVVEVRVQVARNVFGSAAIESFFEDPALQVPLKKDDKVFLFLNGESRLGLTLPVGYATGDFRLVGGGSLENGDFVNRFGNYGLWTGNLWDTPHFWKRVERELDSLKVSEKKQLEFKKLGSSPSCEPLPAEFLIAIVKALKG